MAPEPTLVGLDVGTTGVKALAVAPDGEVLASAEARLRALDAAARAGPSRTPRTGGRAAEAALAGCRAAARSPASGSPGRCTASSCSTDGRVHPPGDPLERPAHGAECAEIEERVGLERLIALTGNRALTGFTAPKLLWLRRHEPDVVRADRARPPARRTTSGCGSPASGRSTSRTPPGRCSSTSPRGAGATRSSRRSTSPRDWLPRVLESPERVRRDARRHPGRRGRGRPGGRGASASASTGPGPLSVVRSERPASSSRRFPPTAPIRQARVHAFCHAVPGGWHAMGVMLSAAGSLEWLRDAVGARTPTFDALVGEAERWEPGRRGAPVPAVPRGRAHAARRPGRSRRVRRPVAPPRPRRARARRARGRRLRAARLARRCCASSASTPVTGRASRRRRAQRPLAPDRRLGARAPARADGRRRGGRPSVRRCSAASPAACSPTSTRRSSRACGSATTDRARARLRTATTSCTSASAPSTRRYGRSAPPPTRTPDASPTPTEGRGSRLTIQSYDISIARHRPMRLRARTRRPRQGGRTL